MKSLKNLTGDSLEQLIDYNVVDQNGDEIGTLHSLWSDPDTGAVEFLGVKTGWLFGHNHVVPAEKADLDEAASVVRLPYTEAFIKDAPSISADAEISEAEENNIYRYYGLDETGTGMTTTETSGHVAASTTSAETAASLAGASGLGDETSPYASPAADASGEADGANRWRRTSRPNNPAADAASPGNSEIATREELLADAASSTRTGGAGSSVRSALDDLSPADSSGTREPLTAAAPGSYGTANLYGSTGTNSAVSADALGAPINDHAAVVGGTSTTDPDTGIDAATTVKSGTITDTAATGLREEGSANPDPITGEAGAHPVGTGVGALGAGAAGAAIGGVVGGPVGAPVGAVVGAVIGAISGGLAGKGVAEAVNPTEQ